MYKYLLSLGLFSLVIVLNIASSDGRATIAGQGNTGAPGDEMVGANPRTCISCHGQTSIQTNTNINVVDTITGEMVTEYLPGKTYLVSTTINVEVGNPLAYGFQIVSLRNSDNQGLETWSNPSSNAKIQFAEKTQRTYVEHKGVSSTNSFSSYWTAPNEGSGPLTFYACGNAVNLSGDTAGDGASLATYTLEETTTSSISQENSNTITAYPNPTVHTLTLSGTRESDIITVYNTNGQLILKTAGILGKTRIDVESWIPSLYQVIIRKDKQLEYQQIPFIKL